jgi:hypothetical protein
VHALTGVRFWLREPSQQFSAPDFGQGPIPDLDQMPSFNADKVATRAYLQTVRTTVETFFSSMNDERLLSSWPIYDKCTYADLILGQIRHLQHHVGYCISLLRTGCGTSTKWLGFGE